MRRVLLPLACAGVMAAPAHAEKSITPYIEVQQVLDAPLNGGGDVLTYTALSAGVDATVSNRRAEGTISYRYEYRIGWGDELGNDDIHSGIARGRFNVTPEISLEAGAIASRARSDIRGDAPDFRAADAHNVSQVYGVYGGPSISKQVGALNVGASYRIGYVKVEEETGIALAPGQPRLDTYDDSTSHEATASVGMESGPLPFGWTVSAGYQREDASQLDQRFEAGNVRADVTVPVTPTLAVTAGAGYEDVEISERAALRDAQGNPVVDNNGRFVTDPDSPRQLAYESDGIIYDAGVIWRPNRRMTLQVRGGRRYGDTAFTGSLDYRISPTSGVQVGVYHSIESFGRSMMRNLRSMPTQFETPRNPLFDNPGGGCVFGTQPGTGGCLDSTFQSVATQNFKSRGVQALYSSERGPWNMAFGGGYAQRRYIAPTGNFFSLDDVTDESWFVQGTLGRQLTVSSGFDFGAYAAWFESGIGGAPNVVSGGANASYYHTFGERLSAQASVGAYGYDVEGVGEEPISGQLLVGMRYIF